MLHLEKYIKIQTIQLFLLLISISALISCEQNNLEQKTNNTEEKKVIANLEVNKKELTLNGNEGNWYYNKQLFNGFALRYHKNDSVAEKVGFYNGKKQGIAKVWFDNGVQKIESHYNKNKLIGSYKAWWDNGTLASEANYTDGKLNGIEKKWYKTG